jgi:hypothetical protein
MRVVKNGEVHRLSAVAIDDLDLTSREQQSCSAWCEVHHRYEIHWLRVVIDGDEVGFAVP